MRFLKKPKRAKELLLTLLIIAIGILVIPELTKSGYDDARETFDATNEPKPEHGEKLPPSLSYSEFEKLLNAGHIDEFALRGHQGLIHTTDGAVTTVLLPDGFGYTTAEAVRQTGAKVSVLPPKRDLVGIALQVAWFAIILGTGWSMMGRRGIFGMTRSSAEDASAKDRKIKFIDVAGCDEAKAELQQVVDFLKNPQKYRKLGADVPQGVLLVGPPGTGKTLLARAVAGEAGVPFYQTDGASFTEMVVGVAAARVRDLFKKARRHKAAIIFIDEIDALGRARTGASFPGSQEQEQALMSLLVELDGFRKRDGTIFIAATNRPEILDPALLRPGRLDRNITVDLGDATARKAVLEVHARKLPVEPDIDWSRVARSIPGLSGADIKNLLNEAAILAAARGDLMIGEAAIDAARDRLILGAKTAGTILSPEERHIVAVHEAGHAIVNLATTGSDPIHKVTILPHGRALGQVATVPPDDRRLHSLTHLRAKLDILMGGRAAETIVLGPDAITTGAESDIEAATRISRNMIAKWGMSPRFGMVRPADPAPGSTERQTEKLDDEIRASNEAAFKRSLDIINTHRAAHGRLVDALIEHETLTGDQVRAIAGLAG